MSTQLQKRQQRILEFLREYLDENGYPPTVREIGAAIGVKSTSLVSYYLRRLEEEGQIARDPAVSRGLRLVDEEVEETVSIPMMGTIVAGEPIASEALPDEDPIELHRALVGRKVDELFALKVQGNSMIDALINSGDTVILRQQQRVENGEMAAVWLDDPGETTLKKVYYEGDNQVRLQPANPTMDPLYVPADNVRIQGKVVMVLRRLE